MSQQQEVQTSDQVGRMMYTMDEAAEELRLGRTALYDLVRSGQLVSIKIGRRRLITREDLVAFIGSLREAS